MEPMDSKEAVEYSVAFHVILMFDAGAGWRDAGQS